MSTRYLADLITKNLTRQDINTNLEALRIEYRGGRAELAPELHHIRLAANVCATMLGTGRRIERRAEDCKLPGEKAKGVRDKWKLQAQFAIRVHAQPCRKMFTPLDAKADDNIQNANFDGFRVNTGSRGWSLAFSWRILG